MNENLQQSVSHVIADAAEGVGFSYWGEVDNVKRDMDGKVSSFQVRDPGYENPSLHEGWVTIDTASLIEGVRRLLSGEVIVRRDLAAQFIGNDWDYDADGIDVLVQAIVFGKLVYS